MYFFTAKTLSSNANVQTRLCSSILRQQLSGFNLVVATQTLEPRAGSNSTRTDIDLQTLIYNLDRR